MNEKYKIIITKAQASYYSGRIIEVNEITLMKGNEIIFDKIKPFQAHKRLWDMELQHLISW